MAISGVGPTAIATAASGNINVDYPTGWAAGELGIMFFYKRGATGTLAIPSGWTGIAGGITNTAANNETMFGAFRIFQGGDSSPVTITDDGTVGKTAFIRSYSGFDAATPIDVAGTWNHTTGAIDGTVTALGVTIATTDATLVMLAGISDDSDSSPFAGVAGMSSVVNFETTIGNDMSVGLFEQASMATGATGNKTSTYDSVGSARPSGLLFAIRPAASASGPPVGSLMLLGVGK